MRKIITLFFILGFALIGQSQVTKTVDISTAGTLSTVLTANELNTVTDITITGTIDARDFKTMRDNMPALAVLEISSVNIAAYFGSGGTSGTSIINYPENGIPACAFQSNSISSITIPISIRTIGDYAFQGSGLKGKIIIPSTLINIGGYAFSPCNGITDFIVDTSNPNYSSIDGILFNKNQTTLLQYPQNKAGSYVVPATVTSIIPPAFRFCNKLDSITIGNSVNYISNYSFQNCLGLTSLSLVRSTPPTLDANTFYGVDKAKCIVAVPIGSKELYQSTALWQDFTNIVERDFSVSKTIQLTAAGTLSTALTAGELNIVNNLAINGILDARDFRTMRDDMPALTNIDLSGTAIIAYSGSAGPAGVKSTGFQAKNTAKEPVFDHPLNKMPAQQVKLLIKATVTEDYPANEIPRQAFTKYPGKTNLKAVRMPNSVISIGSQAFYACGLTSITIPSSVTSIGDDAFEYCSGLKSVTMPSSVTSIGGGAFYACSGLTSITIPSSVTSIGGSAFYACIGLTSITIPSSVISIGYWAFCGCSGLTNVTIPSSVASIGFGPFTDCSSLTSIHVETTNPNYSSINGVLFDKNQLNLVQYPSGKTGNYIIPSSVTSIGDDAFEYCTSLMSVTIPSSVTSIGNYAFYYCFGLTSVTIPLSVTSLGDAAFAYCSGIMNVTIPSSVTSIGGAAFASCSGLKSVTISSSVTSIGFGAFGGCSSLTSITIPSSITSIGSRAFYACLGLTSIYAYSTVPVNISASSWVFDYVNKATCILYVPIGSKSLYQAAAQWKDFANIVEFATAGTFVLNVTAVNGTVQRNPNLGSYASGASVVLTATASTGYIFTSWSGDATGTNPSVTVIMNSNKNVTANFTLASDIEQTELNNSIKVYPNPASESFHINGLVGKASLKFTDISGKEILTKQVTGNESVSISTLSKGMYIVKIIITEGTVERKLVKK